MSAGASTVGAPLVPEIFDASDSRQARSSGSAIWRRPSPSSFGTGPDLRPLGLSPLRSRLALAEDDPVDRLIAEEAVDPLDDQRAQDAGAAARARPRPARSARRRTCSPVGKADRFGRGDPGIALADDLAPAADDRALDEAEAAEGDSADFAHQLAGGARAAGPRRVLGALSASDRRLWLRHRKWVMP